MEIKIVGVAGEGKSTVAEIITNALTHWGFEVELVEADGFNPNPLEARINTLVNKETKVKVETMQARRK